jgi:ubiquinone/menaquinone biosynthesis C-methylase UbiE/uncharacterized protein YbaR (Trm112 family)
LRKEHSNYLACPSCKARLFVSEIGGKDNDRIKSGVLGCSACQSRYDIINYIPRFVPPDNYAHSFGLEWTMHARTQYDSHSGIDLSEKRFFEETKWPKDLSGQVILEVGSGSGRFTEQAAATGAMVVSMDYSSAVDANYASNGGKENVLIVQADVYNMPFAEKSFDKIFCFGMLQHTPRVKEAFLNLPPYLKAGGSLVIDVYRKIKGLKNIFITKYWVRPFTKRLPHKRLYDLCETWVNLIWPISRVLNKVPALKHKINFIILVADYRGVYDLPEEKLKEWAVLDTFDMLSPFYDYPQSIETVRSWLDEADLNNIDAQYGFTGIVARGTKK